MISASLTGLPSALSFRRGRGGGGDKRLKCMKNTLHHHLVWTLDKSYYYLGKKGEGVGTHELPHKGQSEHLVTLFQVGS